MGEEGARLTGESEAFKDEVMARLEPLGGVRSRKMFGGFGIFQRGSTFGIISKTTLFFKVDEVSVTAYVKIASRQHEPMPYYAVPPTVFAKKSTLLEWARTAIGVAHESSRTRTKKTPAKKK